MRSTSHCIPLNSFDPVQPLHTHGSTTCFVAVRDHSVATEADSVFIRRNVNQPIANQPVVKPAQDKSWNGS